MIEDTVTMPERETGESTLLWRCIGAAVQGSSHRKTAKPCQDFTSFDRPTSDVLVAAVADGAGSADLSEVGAALAARTAVRVLSGYVTDHGLTDDVESLRSALTNAVLDARASVVAEASARKVQSRDLASTLILIIASPTLVALAQIGDGGAVLRDRQGQIVCLTLPETSEYINETCFLVSPDAMSQMQVQVWQGEVAQLAVLSDGLQLLCLKMPERTPYERFFIPVFNFVERMDTETGGQEELIKFLDSNRIREQSDDDLTLVLAALNDYRPCKSESDLAEER